MASEEEDDRIYKSRKHKNEIVSTMLYGGEKINEKKKIMVTVTKHSF